MKHFMDIERVKFDENSNTAGFECGDEIVVQCKLDGSNASICLDDDGNLLAFSRKKQLDFSETLHGFWNYIQSFNKDEYKDLGHRILFGEWMGVKHLVQYKESVYGKWYVYDMYDLDTEKWLPQKEVCDYCIKHGLLYIDTKYKGKFKSWDHIKSFLDQPAYGDVQEGVVVKNMSKLNDPNNRLPFYLKIVNSDFAERMEHKNRPKVIDLTEEAAKKQTMELANSLITEARVQKEICKMKDEGVLPMILTAQDMGTVAKTLPHRIYLDIQKEDADSLTEANDKYIGKAIASVCMEHARKVIL